MPRPTVILLRGVPGVGKSTTSALIRDGLQPAVRVSNDDIRYLAKPRDFNAFTLATSEDACMELAATYVERGFTAVVDGVFYDTDFLAAWSITLARRGIPLIVVSLTLTLEDVLMRNRTRDELAQMPEMRLRDLHAGFRSFGHVLDIKENLPEEIAADVVDHVSSVNLERRDEADAVLELLYLRHGLPDYPNGVYPDHMALPLSATGRAEARAARHAVQRFCPDAVFTSDMQRAIDTAAIAAPTVSPIIDEALRERTFPHLYGKRLDMLESEYGPDVRAVFAGNSDTWEPTDAEPLTEARTRVLRWLDMLRQRRDLHRVLVVGHGGPHTWILEQALGVDLATNRALKFDTGHFTKFRISATKTDVLYINRTPDDAY